MPVSLPPQLLGLNRPTHLDLRAVDKLSELIKEQHDRNHQGNAGEMFFGNAFLQGGRIQFNTAMPFSKLLEVAEPDRSRKGDNIEEVGEHANRAINPTHAKRLRSYLMSTACTGANFILPSFTLNWGIDIAEHESSAVLLLFVPNQHDDNTVVWTALLILPRGGKKMSISDGSHRWEGGFIISRDTSMPQDQRSALLANGVDAKIVFESSLAASHQDFADCGKARPIEKSMLALFDIRDTLNGAAKRLVEKTPLLSKFVDGTAANVNLSAGSKNVWSHSAIRNFVTVVSDEHEHFQHQPLKATADAHEFFKALTEHVPQFAALMAANEEDRKTPADLRNIRGGDILMRGTGMTFAAVAFLECAKRGISYDTMARKFGSLDWHLLDCERDDEDTNGTKLIRFGTPYFVQDLHSHVQPNWTTMIATQSDNRYRIFATVEDAKNVWKTKLMPQLFPQFTLAQAAD